MRSLGTLRTWALLALAPALWGCAESVRSPVVSVTNIGQSVTEPLGVQLGGETLRFGPLRPGEKQRVSYHPSADSAGVGLDYGGQTAQLDRPISAQEPGSLGNDVNILLDERGPRLDPKKNNERN